MRMPSDHFVVDADDDIGNVECAGFASHVRMEQDLEQEIAQFLRHFRCVCLLDCVEDFVGFLDKVSPKGEVGLLAVPGTAAGGAKSGLYGDQVFKEFADALFRRFCGGSLNNGDLSARRLRRSLLGRLFAVGAFLAFLWTSWHVGPLAPEMRTNSTARQGKSQGEEEVHGRAGGHL